MMEKFGIFKPAPEKAPKKIKSKPSRTAMTEAQYADLQRGKGNPLYSSAENDYQSYLPIAGERSTPSKKSPSYDEFVRKQKLSGRSEDHWSTYENQSEQSKTTGIIASGRALERRFALYGRMLLNKGELPNDKNDRGLRRTLRNIAQSFLEDLRNEGGHTDKLPGTDIEQLKEFADKIIKQTESDNKHPFNRREGDDDEKVA